MPFHVVCSQCLNAVAGDLASHRCPELKAQVDARTPPPSMEERERMARLRADRAEHRHVYQAIDELTTQTGAALSSVVKRVDEMDAQIRELMDKLEKRINDVALNIGSAFETRDHNRKKDREDMEWLRQETVSIRENLATHLGYIQAHRDTIQMVLPRLDAIEERWREESGRVDRLRKNHDDLERRVSKLAEKLDWFAEKVTADRKDAPLGVGIVESAESYEKRTQSPLAALDLDRTSRLAESAISRVTQAEEKLEELKFAHEEWVAEFKRRTEDLATTSGKHHLIDRWMKTKASVESHGAAPVAGEACGNINEWKPRKIVRPAAEVEKKFDIADPDLSPLQKTVLAFALHRLLHSIDANREGFRDCARQMLDALPRIKFNDADDDGPVSPP